jgi:hypothetical protein
MRWHMLFDNRAKKIPLLKVEYAVSISFSTTFQVHYYDELNIPRIKECNGSNWLASFLVPSVSQVRPVKVFVNNPLLLKEQEVIITRTLGGILSERRYLLAGLHAFEGWFILGD